MGLPSYNNYVGLCVFLFVKTKWDYNFVSYYFAMHITAKALIVMNELKVKLYGFIVCGLKKNAHNFYVTDSNVDNYLAIVSLCTIY